MFLSHFGQVFGWTPIVIVWLSVLLGSIIGSPTDVNYICHTSIMHVHLCILVVHWSIDYVRWLCLSGRQPVQNSQKHRIPNLSDYGISSKGFSGYIIFFDTGYSVMPFTVVTEHFALKLSLFKTIQVCRVLGLNTRHPARCTNCANISS